MVKLEGLEHAPRKNLKSRCSEIESEGNFSRILDIT